MREVNEGQIDPLYVIFEQHLFNFQDNNLDRKTFISNVIRDYFSFLRKSNILVPKSLEQPIIEELSTHVQVMLIKKIYGCLSIEDYLKKVPGAKKKRARARYTRLHRS